MSASIYKKTCKNTYVLSLVFYYIVLVGFLLISFRIPDLISNYIDAVIKEQSVITKSLYTLSLLVVGEFVLLNLKNELNVRLSNKIAFKTEYEISNHVKHAEYKKVQKYDDVYFAQRLNNDSVIVGDFICEKLPYFIFDLIYIVLIMIYSIYTDYKITIIYSVGIVIYLLCYELTKKSIYRLAEKMFDAQAVFFSMLSSQFNNIFLIKINCWFKEKNEEFNRVVKNFYENSLTYLRLEFIIRNSTVFINRILVIAVLFEIGRKILDNSSTFGVMTSFILYTELLVNKLNSCNSFGDCWQKYKLANDRLGEFFGIKLENNGDKKLDSIESIKISNVSIDLDGKSIGYPNICLTRGNKYILKGLNGSGKSTLINLLLGIYNAESGEILYNDVSINELDINYLRRNLISVKTQNPYIENATLQDNLRYGNDNLADGDAKIFADNFLSFISKPMDSYIKKDELSGGEQQKVAICRSCYKNGNVLILDEPTNGLDVKSKEYLMDFLNKITDKIVIIITHDVCFDSLTENVIELK